jgi:hypothetical protein
MLFLPLHQIVQPLILLVWIPSYVPQMLDPSPTLAPAELLKRPRRFELLVAGLAGLYLSLPHILSFSLSFGCKNETEVWSMQLLHFHSIVLPLLEGTRLAPGMRRQVMQSGCIISVLPVAASSG